MTITQRDRDLGTGYAMKPSTTRTELTSVGRSSSPIGVPRPTAVSSVRVADGFMA